MAPRRLRCACVTGGILAIASLLTPTRTAGQLISPGLLASAHADLEGIRNCTRCHELHKPGVSAALCLSCHEPLAHRIEEKRGFHGSLSDVDACADCHKEHFGPDFALVRLDSATFDHRRTGFALEGRHAQGTCRDCHKPSLVADTTVRRMKGERGALGRTYLGLSTACGSCHAQDSPHGTQFQGRACAECHDVDGWKGAREFDHDRTSFRLTGEHQGVACAKCHESRPESGHAAPYVRYVGLAAGRCDDCHEDAHHGAMQGSCASCHNTSAWKDVDRARVESTFDHRTTGFVLEGDHAHIACAACHDVKAASEGVGIRLRFQPGSLKEPFPKPVTGTCLSCHEDRHGGVFTSRADGGDCASCHDQSAWLPATYDAARHNRETSFKLTGAHLAVACNTCHVPTGAAPTFRVEKTGCADCHAGTNPHGDQFAGRSCDACHSVTSFLIRDFDHDKTRYPLDGAHAGAPCGSCHKVEETASGSTMVRYRPLGTECRDCHGGAA